MAGGIVDTSKLGNTAHRRPRLLSGAAVVFGAIGFGAHGALAQCNSAPNPPPPPQLPANFANQSFGNTPPLTPYVIESLGIPGCQGQNGAVNNSGGPGGPGQPGAAIAGTSSGLTILGGSGDVGEPTTGALLSSSGGIGGGGGLAGVADTDVAGGNGGVGGAGGGITIRFQGAFLPDSFGSLATTALSVGSGGGWGGTGGDTIPYGIFRKSAGNGAAGGAGGAVSVFASGSFPAQSTGIGAYALGGQGGVGGDGSAINDRLDVADGGNGGTGGTGGTTNLQWLSGTIRAGQFGLIAVADGGPGGDGGMAIQSLLQNNGGNGGNGGNAGTSSVLVAGGTITVSLGPGLFPPGNAVYVSANGGTAGNGGTTDEALGGGGGSGGTGGAGGVASATVLGTLVYTGLGVAGTADGQAILVQANGGAGGAGANANAVVGQAGGGGMAGPGGSATLELGSAGGAAASVRTSGLFAHGALVQSVGGAGGNGGQANLLSQGGAGAAGGDGGAVTVTAPNARVVTTGTSGIAVLAQSIGGGGGSGGDTKDIAIGAGVAIGGNGGLGGNGSTVRLNLGASVFASTGLQGGAGILAQSIGGAGGAAGSASVTGAGFLSFAVGGDAGGGGTGGNVTVNSGALITTSGDHAAGLEAQSIGGGGGKGGSGFAFSVGVLPTAAVAVGGRGGSGGPAGIVSATNAGQITTYGADAHGVLLQSIGGGGGNGGAAAARAIDLSPDKRVPAVSISVSTGGRGGTGNPGGPVGLTNSGLVTTAGDGSIGAMAQSVGGGGGTGGDSTASSYSGGSSGGLRVSVAVAVGGAGGGGGTGGGVTIVNTGLIATLGQDAYGVFAQSVGGGGGTGGAGDASASSGNGKFSVATAIAVGGVGGSGAVGGPVRLTNGGAITTRGDGSDAVFAQSVGGGGGAAGGGVSNAAGGTLSASVGVGGNGGQGGTGGAVTASNSGSIVTRGTDAIGLSLQSVGGGGGKAGKGGATAGGVSTLSNAQALFDTLSGGLNINQQVQNLGDGILQIGQIGENIQASYDELKRIFSQPQAGESSIGDSVQINIGVAVGGKGGAAGDGGTVSAGNTGAIATYGAQSDGIYAQSVGGGGGSAGAASSTASASDDTPVQTAVGVGGTGGAGGAGGTVTVVNGAGGTIVTQGVAAFGIYAQSVGGGGGEGALAGTVSGSLKSLSVGVGGNGGKGGNGGAVSVTTGDGANTSSITTLGKHGVGVFAQSVGGGGGVVRTMTTDETFDPSKIVVNPQGRLGDVHGLTLTLGGQNGVAGSGGPVQVTTAGAILTSGLDAHGIVAQSIGGGGGYVVGGRVNQPSAGTGLGAGDGGTVTVALQPTTGIVTGGKGAFGILAQSVGGGGGIAGDLSAVQSYQLGTKGVVAPNLGDGGAVTVSANTTYIQTTGAYAPAIFAQSVGGGGGLVNYNLLGAGGASDVMARGSAGGVGSAGAVTVALTNSRVFAEGIGSAAIVAQSDGTAGTGRIRVTLDSTTQLRGGLPDPAFPSGQAPGQRDVAAIRLLGGTGNAIDNAGQIVGDATPAGGTAILANTPSGNTAVTNTGVIVGDIILLGGQASSVDNRAGGVLSAPTTVDLGGGVLRNGGVLHVGGIGTIGTTTLTGSLVQTETGTLRIDVDGRNRRADLLLVSGRAALAGRTVSVNTISLRRGTTDPVLVAQGGIDAAPVVQGLAGPLVSQRAVLTANTLSIATDADFRAGDPGVSATQRSLRGYLQRVWDSDTPGFETGFDRLAALGSAAGLAQALDSLADQPVSAVASARYQASLVAAREAFACPAFVDNATIRTGTACVWARATGVSIAHDAGGGASTSNWRAASVKVGGQTEIRPGLTLGASAGYEGGRLNGAGSAVRATTDTGLGAVALQYQTGQWTFQGVADLAYGSVQTRRTIQLSGAGQLPGAGQLSGAGVAAGSSNVFNAGLHGRAAYTLPLGAAYVEPGLELDLNTVRVDGFTEQGATPFNLKVAALEQVVFAATPGVRVGKRFDLGPGTGANVFGGVGVSVYHGNDFDVDARLAAVPGGAGRFRSTFGTDQVAARFTAGAAVWSANGTELQVQYQGRRSATEAEHGGYARFAYRF